MSEATKMYDRLAEVYAEAVQASAKLSELAVDLQAAGWQASAERYAEQALRSCALANGLWDALVRGQAEILTDLQPVGAGQPGAE